MAKKGRKVTFHGAFASKEDAKRKERAGARRYIRTVKIKGHRRFLVLSKNRG